MSNQALQDRINNDASNVVTANSMLDQLCAVVWMQDGHMMCLAPKGHDEAAALMMYRAADAFADRAPNKKLDGNRENGNAHR